MTNYDKLRAPVRAFFSELVLSWRKCTKGTHLLSYTNTCVITFGIPNLIQQVAITGKYTTWGQIVWKVYN